MKDNLKISISKDDNTYLQLINKTFPSISLPNQEGNLLRLDRYDTFRIVLYCFPMTGRPDRPLPENWNRIPEAKGSTLQNCIFRDNYDEIIKLNALPVGVSTQSIEDNKEMTTRLKLLCDVLSDETLEFKKILNLPNFSLKDKIYLKHFTLIIDKKIIKKVFYPIYSIDKHIYDVLKWLKEN